MPTQDYSTIVIGGPCKITDGAAVFYTEGDAVLEPQPTWRQIPSSVAGEQDAVLVDMHYKLSFVPKPIWNSTLRGVLLPDAMTNFVTTGTRLIGAANRSVVVLGSDGEQYTLTRAILTKMPDLYLGLGASIYGGVEYTAFLGQAKQFSDATAFFTAAVAQAWSQADFPTGHQEAECTSAWGAISGWTAMFAEEGFKLTHESKLEPVKQGNVVIDYKVTGYRAMIAFKPQQPTSAQIVANFAIIGGRLSGGAADFVVTGSGITATVKSAALNRGQFHFDNKLNRHGEWGMITALTVPGTRLVFT